MFQQCQPAVFSERNKIVPEAVNSCFLVNFTHQILRQKKIQKERKK